MSLNYLKYAVVTFAMAGALSACSSQPGGSDSAPVSSSSAPVSSSSAPTPASKPLTAADVKTQLSQNGDLSLDPTGAVLHVPVLVDNQGSADLNSAANPPVNMGVHLLDNGGSIVNADLVHVPLGDIRAASKGSVTVDVPTAQLVDHSISILPLQESVAWFDAFGVAPLKIGPFTSCSASDGSKTLCLNGAEIAKK
jgi:hypothetical protein